MSSAPNRAVRSNICAPATGWPGRPARDRPWGGYSIRCTDLYITEWEPIVSGTNNEILKWFSIDFPLLVRLTASKNKEDEANSGSMVGHPK